MVSRDDVLRARPVVELHLARTPMLASRTLGAYLKCELFQRTGSFKPRGAINKLASLTEEEKSRGIIAISAGNHAQAAAFAAREYGVERARRDVAGGFRAEDRRHPRLRRRSRSRGHRPCRSVRAPLPADRADRAHARPPVRRPGRACGRRNRRPRDRGGRARGRRRRRSGRRRRSDRRDRGRARRRADARDRRRARDEPGAPPGNRRRRNPFP